MIAPALAAIAALASSPSRALPAAHVVSVRLLEHEAPRRLDAIGAHGRVVIDARPGGLFVDGEPRATWEGDSGRWELVLPDGVSREYDGALVVHAENARLAIVLRAPLERYVARVVASESTPDTPRAALEALAIVVRSWALSSAPRHKDARFCDLAHCEWLRGEGVEPRLLDAAIGAARATEGQVLLLRDGRIANATFHAACGGRTADPAEVFGAGGDTGAAAVDDTDAAPAAWLATVTRPQWISAARSVLPRSTRPFAAEELALVRGQGGRIVQIVGPDGERAAGDAFVRALDRARGFGVVRSARFDVRFGADRVRLEGSGIGHGVGLCQSGASRAAASGASASAILGRYFPEAKIGVPGAGGGL